MSGYARPWSGHDDQMLRDLWGSYSITWLARKFGRTYTAIFWRARHLDLQLGCPPGSEYLTAAARRTGYEVQSLRRILAAAGVGLHVAHAKKRTRRRPRHYVDRYEVDWAVAAWMETETLNQAAKRHGMNPATLRRWLLAAIAGGASIPPPPEKGLRWQVPGKAVDRVVLARREPVRGAA